MALSSGPCKCKLVGQQHPTFLGPTCCVPLNTLSHACCWKLLEVVPWGLRYSRLNFKQTSLNCIFLFHNNSSENTFITTVTNIVVKQPVKGLSIVCSHCVSLVIQGQIAVKKKKLENKVFVIQALGASRLRLVAPATFRNSPTRLVEDQGNVPQQSNIIENRSNKNKLQVYLAPELLF